MLGPVMIDVQGTSLTGEEITRLKHPLVGSVILFARNFENPEQLRSLCAQIKGLRSPELLIAVDHEGGRVQRFLDGFTKIPPMRSLGQLWDKDPSRACEVAHGIGYIIGSELIEKGLDFTFAPVLDLDYGGSSVIGDRAFHSNHNAVSDLAIALQLGMRDIGMSTVAKHFPGHGYVKADSHHEIPRDDRTFQAIMDADVKPFADMAHAGLTGVMPAHVIYEKVDPNPAGFSSYWLKDVLRAQVRFDGAIFSDDLSMEGASVAGATMTARAKAAMGAGADVVLLCNSPDKQMELLNGFGEFKPTATWLRRMEDMRAKPDLIEEIDWVDRYRDALDLLAHV
jgi:beta-N-acetylhexosaminidase